jgi:hypothetical protein
LRQCRRTGKVMFATYASANETLRDCERKRKRLFQTWRMERGVYLCDHCDAWHLTSHSR